MIVPFWAENWIKFLDDNSLSKLTGGITLMYRNALSIRPPLHPLFPNLFEQSTRFCSLKETKRPVFRKCCPMKNRCWKIRIIIAPEVYKTYQIIVTIQKYLYFSPSNAPVVENAQQDPHWPWSLTSVTAPWALQSTSSGNSTWAENL